MKYRVTISAIIAVLMVLALGACAPAAPSQPTPGGSAALPVQPYPTKAIMTTVSVGGAFQVYGAAVSNIIEKYTKVVVAPQPTSGGVESVQLMLRNESQLCTATSITMNQTWIGEDPFPKAPNIIRSVSGAYESYVHVFVRADSSIKSWADLKGKRCMFDRPGERSFSDPYTATLKAYGLSLSDVTIMPALTYAEAATALQQRQADAVMQLSALPSPQFLDLARTLPIRLLPIETAKYPAILKACPAFYPGVVKGGIYNGTPDDTPTLVFAAWISMRADVADDFAYNAIKAVCENIGDLNAAHAQFKTWTPKNLAANITVPYAAGVYKYYKEKGLLTAADEQKHKDMLAQTGQTR